MELFCLFAHYSFVRCCFWISGLDLLPSCLKLLGCSRLVFLGRCFVVLDRAFALLLQVILLISSSLLDAAGCCCILILENACVIVL